MTEQQPMTTADRAEALMEHRKREGWTWAEYVDRLTVEAADAAGDLALARRLQLAIENSGGQLPLIADDLREPTKRRKARRVMMHSADKGLDGFAFLCPKCKSEELIHPGMTKAAIDRGIPCPKCNTAETTPCTT